MKRQTALRNVLRIQERLRQDNVFQTPKCRYAAYVINNVWLHGSLCTQKENPNDVDLLFNGESLGVYRGLDHPDTVAVRSWHCVPRSAEDQALVDLRKGMRMIRYDEFYPDKPWEDQAIFQRINATKIQIFPHCELDKLKNKHALPLPFKHLTP